MEQNHLLDLPSEVILNISRILKTLDIYATCAVLISSFRISERVRLDFKSKVNYKVKLKVKSFYQNVLHNSGRGRT